VTFSSLSDPGAGHALPLIDEGLTSRNEREEYATLYARTAKQAGQLVGYRHQGSMTLQGMYNNLDRVIGCAMGFENPNDSGATYKGSPELAASGKYAHLYELDDVLSEEDYASAERNASGAGGGTWTSADDKVRFGTLAILKEVSEWGFAPVMFNRMVITATWQRVTIRFDVVAFDHDRVAVGTLGSSSWALADNETHLIMPDAEFKIGSVDGTSLAWQEMGISRFELVLENQLVMEADTQSGLYIREPVRGGMRTVNGGFDFVRYDSDALIDEFDDNTEMKAWLKFSNGDYKFNIYLPSFYIDQPNYNVAGPGVIKPKHRFTAHKPSTLPFDSDADLLNIDPKKDGEFMICVHNDYSSNFLTEEA
jgi:hypothetical protein